MSGGGPTHAAGAAAFAAPPEDRDAVRAWFAAFGAHVAALDYAAARPFFAEDAVGFGTWADVIVGRAAIEREQWRSVWPTIEDFRFELDTLRVHVSPDGTLACAVVAWSSRGIAPDGGRFHRPGRATVALARAERGAPWRALHSHFSLNRDVPQRSHGRRRA